MGRAGLSWRRFQQCYRCFGDGAAADLKLVFAAQPVALICSKREPLDSTLPSSPAQMMQASVIPLTL